MRYLITLLCLISISNSYAQNINWANISEQTNYLTYLNLGYEHGLTTQVGMAKKLPTTRPVFVSLDYSLPMGNELFDDLKLRLGGQIPIYSINRFTFSTKLYGTYKRHETSLVRMSAFGSEIGIITSYNRPSWHIAAELGYDKTIVTHLKHSEILQENYPAITDGWFIPSGGHFYFGVQSTKTLKDRLDLSIRAGITKGENGNDALIPYYTQLGIAYRWNKNRQKQEKTF